MSNSKTVDPEVQAILEEVARDPRSHLLRVPKLQVPTKYEAPVRDRDALLTKAERYLVKVHRFEVADLLYQEVWRVLFEREEAKGRLLKYVRSDEVSEAVDPLEWESNARYRLGVTVPEVRGELAFSLLERCVRKGPTERPTAVEMATASLRLVPRATTRICLAFALYQAGQTESGMAILLDVLDHQPSEMSKSYAWQNLGLMNGSLGREAQELEAMREASLALEYRGDPAMAWFFSALRSGDPAEALRSGRQVGESVPENHPSITAFLRVYSAPGHRLIWGIDKTFRQTFHSISDQLPPQAQQIGDVLSK